MREFSLTIEALRRKLRQPASSAVMISAMRSARGKIHGIARAVHNSEKRAGYNLAHRAVSGFSAISELAHSLHQTEHGLFRVPSKKEEARLETSVKRRTFGRSVRRDDRPCTDGVWLQRALTAEDRRVARNWAWGVLVVYSACALTIFALASLSQHSANGPKEPAATAVTATADRNQRTR